MGKMKELEQERIEQLLVSKILVRMQHHNNLRKDLDTDEVMVALDSNTVSFDIFDLARAAGLDYYTSRDLTEATVEYIIKLQSIRCRQIDEVIQILFRMMTDINPDEPTVIADEVYDYLFNVERINEPLADDITEYTLLFVQNMVNADTDPISYY